MVRTFNPELSPMPVVSEIALKLARKCLDVFGSSGVDPESDIHTIRMFSSYEIEIVR